MEQIPFFLIARILLGLAAGFWLVRKMRGFIRKLAVGLMPVRYRVSERSFHLQTRLSASLAFFMAFCVALAVFLGLGKVERAARQHPWIEKEESTYSRHEPQSQTMEILSTEPVYPAPESGSTAQDSLPAEEIQPPQDETGQPRSYDVSGGYYAQLFAFQQEERAWAQQRYWEKRLSYPVLVAIAPGTRGPYKVLVGPFRQKQDARAYLRQQKLQGFPRNDEGLRLYED
ncbi:MAG: SPOR domain-containing protein [Phaeodactylibacter sp.]|nr:SPOR domain-containing protein [Phaeodactylibacter sp.]